MSYPKELQRIIHWFGRLPGIGSRTAERLALSLMQWKQEDVAAFGTELAALREKIGFCPVCGNYSLLGELCPLCADEHRQRDIVCVVEEVSQIGGIEKAGCYHGLYHVLGGTLSPMSGIGPQDLRIDELKSRLASGEIKEVLLALSANVEGEATSQYLLQELSRDGLTITRLAAGIPVGANLAYADAATLAAAINSRRKL